MVSPVSSHIPVREECLAPVAVNICRTGYFLLVQVI